MEPIVWSLRQLSKLSEYKIDEVRLLLGAPIEVPDNIALVKSVRLKEIAAMGTREYFGRLNMLVLDLDSVQEMTANMPAEIKAEFSQASVYEFLLINAKYNELFYLDLMRALTTFITEPVLVDVNAKRIYIGDLKHKRYMTENEFRILQHILRVQNMIPDDLSEEEEIPENEDPRMRKFREKRKLLAYAKKKKREKASEDEEAPEFEDLVSSVCSMEGNGITILNVGDLTIYQLYNQLYRGNYKEEYNNNLQSIFAGADPKKIKMKHWIRRLEIKD